MLEIRQVSSRDADAIVMMDRLSARLENIVGNPGRNSFADWREGDEGHLFVVAYEGGLPVGCGGLRMLEAGVGEIKRMYADRTGAGIGSTILAFLEEVASGWGLDRLLLETRAINATATRFYERQGYRPTAPYGRYAGRSDVQCFAKDLARPNG